MPNKVVFFVGIRTTLRELFSACIPEHPLELYHLFREQRFTFLKEDEHHASFSIPHEASKFVFTDILRLIDYFRKLWKSVDDKTLDSPIAIADEVIAEYQPTDFASGEERTGLEDIKLVHMEETLDEYARKLGLKNFSIGVFIKTVI